MTDNEETDDGVKMLIKLNQLQSAYQNLTEEDEDGNIVQLKMQATKEFKLRFNEFVHSILLDCVNSARDDGRKMMLPEDVPTLQDV